MTRLGMRAGPRLAPVRPRTLRTLGVRGMVAVEFALVSAAFFTIMLLTMEVCYDLAIGAALDFGGRAASRFGTTGAVTLPGAGGTSRVDSITGIVIQTAGGLLSATNLQMTEASYANLAALNSGAPGIDGPGGTSQFVVYTLTYTQPWLVGLTVGLTGSASLIHTSSLVVLNEPF